MNSNSRLGIAELEKVFQEYKTKLELAEQESSEIINRAWQQAENVIAEGEEKTQSIASEIKRKATEEGNKIITEAKNKAEEIIKEADDKAKKEAKDRTRREVERILSSAQQLAEKQAAEVILKAKKDVEQIVNEIKEMAKAEGRHETAKIVAEARDRVKKANDDSIQRLAETDKFLAEVGRKAESAVEQCKTQIQTTLSDLLLAVAKARDNLEFRNIMDKMDVPDTSKTSTKEIEKQLLKGHRELKIIPPYDDLQRKRFMEFLQQIPSIRLAGKSGTEDGETISINITEPLPLLTLLHEMSLVSSFDVRGETIKLKLRPAISGN